jgi:hypothetical protein
MGQILKISKLSNGGGQQKEPKMDKTPLNHLPPYCGIHLIQIKCHVNKFAEISKEQWGVPCFNISGF